MSTVLLGNVASEAMAPSARLLSDSYLQAYAAAAKRMIWFAKNDDILITPSPVTRHFVDYVNDIKGGSNIASLSTTSRNTTRPFPISKTDIEPGSRLSNAMRLLASGRVSCLEPYIADEISICIARFLGDVPVTFSNQTVRASPDATRRLNDKAKFREYAPSLGVPIASGSVCVDTRQVVDAVRRTLAVSDKVILKAARHSGGNGNFVISTSIEKSFRGAARAICIREVDANCVRTGVQELGLIATEKEPVVVEAYRENEASIGVHFDVTRGGAELVGVASILLNPGYGGAYWDGSRIDEVPKDVLAWCQNLGNYAREAGYCGPLSVDIVKAKDIGFFACEVNGRHGGFSMMRAVSTSLGLEADIKTGERVVLFRNVIPIDIKFSGLVDLLEHNHLNYNWSVKRGAVVMAEGYGGKGPFDFLIVGSDLGDVHGIERAIIGLAGGVY